MSDTNDNEFKDEVGIIAADGTTSQSWDKVKVCHHGKDLVVFRNSSGQIMSLIRVPTIVVINL